MEQVLNAWLAEQKPMQPHLLQLSSDCLQAFGRWADDIAAGAASAWGPEPFCKAADAMRLDGTLLPLVVPGAAVASDGRRQAVPDATSDTPSQAVPATVDAPDAGLQSAEQPPAQMPVAQAEATGAIDLSEPLIADFAETEMMAEFAAAAPDADVSSSTVTEDIDFSVFTEALNEAQTTPVVASEPLPLDLELPDLEPMAFVAMDAATNDSVPDKDAQVDLDGLPLVSDGAMAFVPEPAQASDLDDAVVEPHPPGAIVEPVAVAASAPEEEVPADEAVK